ncbi:MAG TPA: hypothetical protein VMA95_01215 [Streptosporangiaceae bacterium]|nr:hypothetical protein [Streptosporangiaceae bacterium]
MCSIAAETRQDAGPEGQLTNSRTEQRLTEIEHAIDELASLTGPTQTGATEPIVARVAELWALLAELDPEVARRLAGYQRLSSVPTRSELGNRPHGRQRASARHRAGSIYGHTLLPARVDPATTVVT